MSAERKDWGQMIVLLGALALLAAVLSACPYPVRGTGACTPWHDEGDLTRCRTCPTLIECVRPRPTYKDAPDNG